ncbi:MAG TPA: hypothetical protein VJ720_13940, partial [Chitinophaga sp.]|nr:hypothetical protein [Chitinophaga sp.]
MNAYFRALTVLLVSSILFAGCSTMKKIKTSSIKESISVDSSRQEKQYEKETVTTEKASVPVIIPADSLSFNRWFSVLDTTGFVQIIDADGMTLETTIKPRMKNGKP